MHPYCEAQHGYRRREKGNKNAGVSAPGIWMLGCEKRDDKLHRHASYALNEGKKFNEGWYWRKLTTDLYLSLRKLFG